MAGFDSARAIGAVSQLLKNQLGDRTAVYVTVGHPETASDGATTRFNLFLYEATFDASMRSRSLDEQRPAPLWLVLRYLLTAYDGGTTDTIAAHRSLGAALRALTDLAYLPVADLADDRDTAALRASPEPLKITFVDASSELVGRVLQGSDERYRFSIAFELRPVMIASTPAGEDALLVGVPYRPMPPTDPRAPGVSIVLDPALAVPTLTRVTPTTAALGATLTLTGAGFGAGDIASIGPMEHTIAPIPTDPSRLGVTLTSPDRNAAVVAEIMSAGPQLVTVAREVMRAGRPRRRTSNAIIVGVLPTLATAVVTDTVRDDATPEPGPRAVVTLDLEGALLGTERDDAVVALWSAGRTAASTDDLIALPGDAQTRRRAAVRGVPAGSYRVIVRVNGSQAIHSPIVDVVVPP